MRILYGIQGTGNGHLSRARKIVPILKEFAEVEVILSGTQSQLDANFTIDYQFSGLPFIASKRGGIDYVGSILKSHPYDLIRDIRKFPIKDYDLVISDFEPISSWSALLRNVPCIELSHNVAVALKSSPKPPYKDKIGQYVLNHYCPSHLKFGFHFQKYTEDVFLPIIRDEVRELAVNDESYYLVYLPAYHDKKIIEVLSHFNANWIVFSKYAKAHYSNKNIEFHPIENDNFIQKLANASGVLCGAGFELPAEVLHLKKKLMVIPMEGQYEQWCNAYALRELGIPFLPKLDLAAHRSINNWIQYAKPIAIQYPETTREDIQFVLNKSNVFFEEKNSSSENLKTSSIKNIFRHTFGSF